MLNGVPLLLILSNISGNCSSSPEYTIIGITVLEIFSNPACISAKKGLIASIIESKAIIFVVGNLLIIFFAIS